MVGDSNLNKQHESLCEEEIEVVHVNFPYSKEPESEPEEDLEPVPPAAIKVDYLPKEISPPKKTPVIRRAVRTRLVRLENELLSDDPVQEFGAPPVKVPSQADMNGTIQKLLKTVGNIGLTTQENQRQCASIATELDRQAGTGAKLDAIQKHLDQSHKVETANQRLFDAMYDELKGYKDNFLFDALQKPIIRDLLSLFDDLCGQARRIAAFIKDQSELDEKGAAWKSELQASHANLNNTVFFVIEVLNRLDVTMMEGPHKILDIKNHKVVGFDETTEPCGKNDISRVVRPGFFWKDRVLRPAEVIIKKHLSAEISSPEEFAPSQI